MAGLFVDENLWTEWKCRMVSDILYLDLGAVIISVGLVSD